MYFKVNIVNRDVLLNAEQLETLTTLLLGSDTIVNEYVGNGKGDDGTNYRKVIRPLDLTDVPVNALPDNFVEAMRLKTKLADEADGK